MGRDIVTKRNFSDLTVAEGIPPVSKPDNYASQIVKLIPVEVVGVYLGISNLIAGQTISEPSMSTIQSVVFFIILIITPIYLWHVAAVIDKIQIIVTTISFVIWAISLGGPFEFYFENYLPQGLTIKFLGGILIMIYTLIVPMFYKAVPKN